MGEKNDTENKRIVSLCEDIVCRVLSSLSTHLCEYVLNNSFSQHSKDVAKEFYVLNIIKTIRNKIPNSISETHKETKSCERKLSVLIMLFEYALNLSVIKNKLSNVPQNLKSLYTLLKLKKKLQKKNLK